MVLALGGPSAGNSALKPLSAEKPGREGSGWAGLSSVVGRKDWKLGASFFLALRLRRIMNMARQPTARAPRALPIPIPAFSPAESPVEGGAVVGDVGIGGFDSAGLSLLVEETVVECVG